MNILLAHQAMPKPIAPPTTIAPAIGAAATTKPPTAVPTALAPDAIVPIPVATEEPAVATAVPAVPSPTADNALPRLDDAELTEFENALTALLLALEMDDPRAFAPAAERAEPVAIPTVAPTVPVIAL